MYTKSKSDYLKAYYKNNKQKYEEYSLKNASKIVHCDVCNKDIKYLSKSQHMQSKKHKINSANYNKNDEVLEKKIIDVLRKLIDF
jgi:hypothetical protein